MLTRLQIKRDYRLFTRRLCDKPLDNDAKKPQAKKVNEDAKKKSETIMNTEKIQTLLKNMMQETKMKESEYKEKFTTAPDIPKRHKKNKNATEVTTEKIEENLTKAAADVAQAIGGNVKQTEAELLSRVLGKINQTSTNLSDLILGMKVDRSKDVSDESKQETRGQQVKRLVTRPKPGDQTRYMQRKEATQYKARQPRSIHEVTVIDLFSEQPLGIFKKREPNYGTPLELWQTLKERELRLSIAQPPANYFQKMALWTRQGKVWKFPIDNEQGLEEEQEVPFSDHIFLEAHLEDWCPKKGPIRHYMELVCVGLSKNPFYTAKEKKDHIMWYKEYFESKKSLLTEVGAWDNVKSDKNEAFV